MKTKQILLILGIYLLIITSIRLVVWVACITPPPHPNALQGTIDLTTWDYSSNHAIPLDGEWEFYTHAFYMNDYEMLPAPPKS